MLSLRLSVSAVLLGVLAATTSGQSIERRQAPGVIQCAAATFADVPQVIASCNFITLYNFTVPAGQTLDLRGVQPNTVIFVGRAITFLPSPGFAGPLVRFGGSGLYVNGGAGFFDGFGSGYWGQNGTSPTLISIENVTNSVFEKLIVANSPALAVSITGSSGLTFKGVKVLNQAAFVAASMPILPGVAVASSSNITLGGLNITTTGQCVNIDSGSTATVVSSLCNNQTLSSTGTVQQPASNQTVADPVAPPQNNTSTSTQLPSSTIASSTASSPSSTASSTSSTVSSTSSSSSPTSTPGTSGGSGTTGTCNTNTFICIIGGFFGRKCVC